MIVDLVPRIKASVDVSTGRQIHRNSMLTRTMKFYNRTCCLFVVLCSVAASVLLTSCSGTNDASQKVLTSEGVITGPDFRRCMSPCCGGWFITIDGKQYRFLEFPQGTDPSLPPNTLEEYPVEVKLIWEPNERACGEDLINVLAIRRE